MKCMLSKEFSMVCVPVFVCVCVYECVSFLINESSLLPNFHDHR